MPTPPALEALTHITQHGKRLGKYLPSGAKWKDMFYAVLWCAVVRKDVVLDGLETLSLLAGILAAVDRSRVSSWPRA